MKLRFLCKKSVLFLLGWQSETIAIEESEDRMLGASGQIISTRSWHMVW